MDGLDAALRSLEQEFHTPDNLDHSLHADLDANNDFPGADTDNNVGTNADSEIEYLKRTQQKKIRALLRVNEQLQKQIDNLKLEGKDNVRVKLIKDLRVQCRAQDALIEGLKKSLTSKASLSAKQVDELIEEILSKPKLEMPPRPEQFTEEIAKLTKENARLCRLLHDNGISFRKGAKGASIYATASKPNSPPRTQSAVVSPSKRPDTATSNSSLHSHSAELPSQHHDCKGQCAVLQAALDAKDRSLQAHKEMLQQSLMMAQQLREYQNKWQDAVGLQQELSAQLADMQSRLEQAQADSETYHHQMDQTQRQLLKLTQSHAAVQTELNGKIQQQTELLTRLKERESTLTSQLTKMHMELEASQVSSRNHKSNNASADQVAQTRITQLEKDLSKLHAEKTDLQSKLTQVTSKCAEAEQKLKDTKPSSPLAVGKESARDKAAYNKLESELRGQIAFLSSELAAARAKPAATSSLNEPALQNKITALEREKKKWTEEKAKLQDEQSYQETLNSHLKTKMTELKLYVTRMEAALKAAGVQPPDQKPDLKATAAK